MQEIGVVGLGGAGNWLSAIQRVKEELHRDRPVENNLIQRAFITAIQFYRWTRFHFNEGSASMMTFPGVLEYGPENPVGSGNGYPSDLLEIDQIQIFQNPVEIPAPDPDPGEKQKFLPREEQSSNFAHPMERIDMGRMRLMTESAHSGNRPYFYAWHHDTLFVYPQSSGGRHRLMFDYLRDLDFPRARFVGGRWVFVDRFGAPIDDDYSTPWLEHAEELIRNRAKADLWANVFYDTEKAQLCRGQEREALRNLGGARSMRLATGRVRAYF